MFISIGVITHKPYIENYCRLVNELISQIILSKNINEIEIVSILQDTEEIPGSLTEYPAHRIYLYKECLTPPQARNEVIRKTKGTWISFIDGDCLPGSDYITSLYRELKTIDCNTIGAVQGTILPSKYSYFGKYEYLLDVWHLYGSMDKDIVKKFDIQKILNFINGFNDLPLDRLQGFNCCISRHLIAAVGMFDENIATAEDREYGFRIQHSNLKIIIKSSICIFHDYNFSLSRISRRKKWHAISAALLFVKYPEIEGKTIKDIKVMKRILNLKNPFYCKPITSFYFIFTTIVYMAALYKEYSKIRNLNVLKGGM